MTPEGAIGCFECGGPVEHHHHVVPKSMGGTRTVPLCEKHHGMLHGVSFRTSALTRAALKAKRARGERIGAVPYGYSATQEGRLVPNAAEQWIITIVRELRAAGVSLRAVVSELARRGKVSRTGRALQFTQVARIAKRTA